MSVNKVPLTSGLPYQKNQDPSFERAVPNVAMWPTKTVTGKNVTPGRNQITGAIGQNLLGSIDLGFDIANDALMRATGYNTGSITGDQGVINDGSIYRAQNAGSVSMGGMGMLPILALGAAVIYFATR
ncbi:MAG: hypothetical protein CBD02_04605 [Candidatus Pelagibacter sp. TMED142]|nr:MAG: hypothetical protein CBD02_04605 [Candidatus Pelagibacter sp. TMED142]